MIVNIRADIDSMDKIGALIPQLDGGWATRYPMFNGAYKVGSYRVPVNKKLMLRSITAHAEFKGIQMTNALGGFPLATAYFKVNGTTKMEYRLQWSGGTFNAITSDTTFGYNWRSISGLNGLPFVENDVITIEVSPYVTAGLVPQVRWAGQFFWKLSTGRVSNYKFETITITGDENQVIASYTVPSGGVTLKHYGLQGVSTDFMMGVIQIRLDGANVATIPVYSSAMMTRPVPLTLPFLNGLLLGEGSEITVHSDFTHALNQTVEVTIFGDEMSYGSGSPNFAFIGN